MRAAVNVQHLAGDLARLGEVEHSLCDVLGARNLPKGRQCAQELLGIVLVQRGIHDAWSHHVHANALRRVFHRETPGYRVDTALGDHWDGFPKKLPGSSTGPSTEPNRFTAVTTIISAVEARPMSPSTRASLSERCSSFFWLILRELPTTL